MFFCGGCIDRNPGYIGRTTDASSSGSSATAATSETDATTVGESSGGSVTGEPTTGEPTTGETTGATTEPNLCGNGMPDPGEQCDQGPQNGQSDCTSWCAWAMCGDGEQAPFEACDEGVLNGTGESDCTSWCENAYCGDGEIAVNEECDDGQQGVGEFQDCLPGCKKNICGDKMLSPNEECDPIIDPMNLCNDLCERESCGNKEINESLEQCDNSVEEDPDCLDFCMYEPEVWFGNALEWDEFGAPWEAGGKISCGGELPMAGIYGRFDLDEERFAQVGPRCGQYEVEPFGDFGFIYTGGGFGNSGNTIGEDADIFDGYALTCPDEQVFTGIGGSLNEAGDIETLVLFCSRVTLLAVLNHWEVHVSIMLPAAAYGVDLDELPMPAKCPKGWAVSELKAAWGPQGGLRTIKIGCRQLISG